MKTKVLHDIKFTATEKVGRTIPGHVSAVVDYTIPPYGPVPGKEYKGNISCEIGMRLSKADTWQLDNDALGELAAQLRATGMSEDWLLVALEEIRAAAQERCWELDPIE